MYDCRMMKSVTALVLTAAIGATLAAQQAPAQIPAPPNVAKPPAEAVKTASGLASIVLQAGTGKVKPGPTDIVTVHYTGWTTDGKMFDSSLVRNATSSFPVNRVIKRRPPRRHAGLRRRVAQDRAVRRRFE